MPVRRRPLLAPFLEVHYRVFAHWVTTGLPRLAALFPLLGARGAVALVPRGPRYVRESLILAGVPEGRVEEYDERLCQLYLGDEVLLADARPRHGLHRGRDRATGRGTRFGVLLDHAPAAHLRAARGLLLPRAPEAAPAAEALALLVDRRLAGSGRPAMRRLAAPQEALSALQAAWPGLRAALVRPEELPVSHQALHSNSSTGVWGKHVYY